MVQTQLRIQTVIDSSGAQVGGRKVRQELKRVGNEAGRTEKKLKKAFFLAGGVFLIRDTLQLVDSYTRLENRLKAVSETQEDFATNLRAVQQIALETRTSVAATTEVYARLIQATADLDVDSRRLMAAVRTLNQMIILSGLSAKEAENGLIQLSQGLASGTLRGDELRSVMEQMPPVVRALENALNKSRGEIRKMGEQGLISSGVILDALAGAADETERRFEAATITVGQAFENLRTQAIFAFGEIDDAIGISDTLSASFMFLSENVKAALSAVLAFGGALAAGALMKQAIKATVFLKGSFESLAIATMLASDATGAFNKAMVFTKNIAGQVGAILARHPLLWLGTVAAGVTFAIVGLSEAFRDHDAALEVTIDNYDRLSEEMAKAARLEVLPGLLSSGNDELDQLSEQLNTMRGLMEEFRRGEGSMTVEQYDQMEVLLGELETRYDKLGQKVAKVSSEYEGLMAPMREYIAALTDEIELLGEKFDDKRTRDNEIEQRKIIAKLAKEGYDTDSLTVQTFLSLVSIMQEQRDLAKDAREQREAEASALEQTKIFMAETQKNSLQELALAHMTTVERAAQVRLMNMYNDAKARGAVLSAEELKELERLSYAMAEQIEKRRILSQYSGDFKERERIEKTKLIEELLQQELLTVDEATRAMNDMFEETIDKSVELARALKANIILSGFQAVEDSIISLVTTGRGNFRQFVQSMLEEIARLMLRLKILLPLMQAIFPDGGFEVSKGGNITASTDTPVRQNGGSWMVGSGMPRFASGGSMMVGGNGGTDSQLVMFRASPNEEVSVRRPEQRKAAGGTVNVQVINNAPNTDVSAQRNPATGEIQVIIDQAKSQMAADLARGGSELNSALEGRYGLNSASGIQIG